MQEVVERKNQEIKSQKQNNQKLSGEKSDLIKNLERIVAEKQKMQEEMLQKFVMILNTKKAKIRDLKKQVLNISAEKS